MSVADKRALETGYHRRGDAWPQGAKWYPGSNMYSTTNLVLVALVAIAGWYFYKRRK
jgi:hypothetical protein